MTFQGLFIRSISQAPTEEANKTALHIPMLNINDPSGARVIAIDVVPCDAEGNNCQEEQSRRVTLEQFNQFRRHIYLYANKNGDTYYRIAPVVLFNGQQQRIQLQPEDDKGNLVKISQIKTVINYVFTPRKEERGGIFGRARGVIPAKLVINCTQEIPSGTIGYVINNFFFPIPKIERGMIFEMYNYMQPTLRLEFADAKMAETYTLVGNTNPGVQ